MKVVIALGGNALLERGEAPNSDIQESHVVSAVTALAPLARSHQLLITHGNGPQVGVLALESARDPALSHPYPFDVLGAQTQGMIGYWLVQALHNAVPGQPAGCLICRTIVRGDDPAFAYPTKFVGPVYDEAQARQLAAAPRGPGRSTGPLPRSCAPARSRPGPWARRWKPPAASWRRPAGWPRSAGSTTPRHSWTARPARSWRPRIRGPRERPS